MSVTGVSPNLVIPDQSSTNNTAQHAGTLDASRKAQDLSKNPTGDVVNLPRTISADIKKNAIDERKKAESEQQHTANRRQLDTKG